MYLTNIAIVVDPPGEFVEQLAIGGVEFMDQGYLMKGDIIYFHFLRHYFAENSVYLYFMLR